MNRLAKRLKQLPILIEELKNNLLIFDIERNQVSHRRFHVNTMNKIEKQKKELENIENIEKFITHMMVSQHRLFSYEVSKLGDNHMEPRLLEKMFFTFNGMYEHRPIRGDLHNSSFSSDIQYSSDFELFLLFFDNLEKYTYLTPDQYFHSYIRSRTEKVALKSNIQFKSRTRSNSLFKKELTENEKRKLYGTSEEFFKELHSEFHTKKLNQIDSNCLGRYKSACEYVSNLFDQHKSLTFISLDLCFQPYMSEEDKLQHLKDFKNRIRQHSLFSEMKGYLGKWEYTYAKNTYIRMIFIFSKIEKYMEDTIPELIGGFWNNGSREFRGSFHYALIASGDSKLNATLCTISSKQERLRQELENRTLFYLTYAQSYYRYTYPNLPIPTTSNNKRLERPRKFAGPRDLFFKGELPADVVAAKKEIKRIQKRIKQNKVSEKEQQDVKDEVLEKVKENFISLMKFF